MIVGIVGGTILATNKKDEASLRGLGGQGARSTIRSFAAIEMGAPQEMISCLKNLAGALVVALIVGSSITLPSARAADVVAMPAAGNEVVIYTHRFQPQHFEVGLELVSNGFAEAIRNHGQNRHNSILVHPSTFEVVNISFFEDAAAVEEWHSYDGRLEVIEKLEPLMVGPIDIKVFTTSAVHVLHGAQ